MTDDDFDQFDCFESNYEHKKCWTKKPCKDCISLQMCAAENELYNHQLGKFVYLVIEEKGDLSFIRAVFGDPYSAVNRLNTWAMGDAQGKRIDTSKDFPVVYSLIGIREIYIEKQPFTIDSVQLGTFLTGLKEQVAAEEKEYLEMVRSRDKLLVSELEAEAKQE